MSTIESWTMWDPSWVSVDLHRFDYKNEKMYRGALNICLEQGDQDEEMKVITVFVDEYDTNMFALAMKLYGKFSEIFENSFFPEINVFDPDGAIETSFNLEALIRDMTEIDEEAND